MKPLFLLLFFLAVLGLLIVPGSLSKAHASTAGLVCLADVSVGLSSPANPCSAGAGPVFDGPLTSPIQQIRIGVFISNSAGFNAFDITLKTNSAVLKPSGIDASGSILGGNLFIIAECVGTANLTISGNCKLSTDTPDTLQLVAGITGLTPTPSTGLLFTAIYDITAKSNPAVSVGFQTGCSNSLSSVGGSVCVALVSGGPPIPETVRGATFNNTISIPYMTVSSVSNIVGPMLVGSTQGLRLNLTGHTMWSLLPCPCPVALSIVKQPGLSAQLNTTSASVPSSGLAFVNLNASAAKAGNYSVTVFAQYSTFDLQNAFPDTLVAHVTLQVVVTDFALSGTPLNIAPALVGLTASSAVAITALNGFSGTVQLSTVSSGGQCVLSSNSIQVPGTSGSVLNCSSLSIGNYTVTVTGISRSVSHSIQIGFAVQDFTASVSASTVSVAAGSSASLGVTVVGLNGFSQVVTVSVVAPSGLTVAPVQTTFMAPGTVSLSLTGNSAGVYNVTITVTSSTVSRSAIVQVRVTPPTSLEASTLFGLAPALFYTLLAIVGAVAVGIVVLVVLRRRSVTTL